MGHSGSRRATVLQMQNDEDGCSDGIDPPRAQGNFLQDPIVLQPGIALLGAGSDVGVNAVETALRNVQFAVLGDLVRTGKTGPLTFVAQVGQHRVPGTGELDQRGQQIVMGAGAGDVVLASGSHR